MSFKETARHSARSILTSWSRVNPPKRSRTSVQALDDLAWIFLRARPWGESGCPMHPGRTLPRA